VNGEVDMRRGRQLHPGDVVTVLGRSARVVR
jgi:ribosome-associated protein